MHHAWATPWFGQEVKRPHESQFRERFSLSCHARTETEVYCRSWPLVRSGRQMVLSDTDPDEHQFDPELGEIVALGLDYWAYPTPDPVIALNEASLDHLSAEYLL